MWTSCEVHMIRNITCKEMSQAAVGVVLSINIVGKAEIYIDVLT